METLDIMISRISSEAKLIHGGTKIKNKTLRRLVMDFYLNGEILYKKSSYGTLLRCLDEAEVKGALREVLKGIC